MSTRRIILTFVISIFLVLGSSLAQLEWIWSTLNLTNLEETLDSFSGESRGSEVAGDGQIVTQVDSGRIVALWLDLSGGDISLLSGENGSGNINSWPNLPIISDPIPRLILSEVYYDGTDERIEITNIGSGNFQGNFILSGVKSTSISLTNISIPVGESKIFGDNLLMILGTSFIGKTGLAFNILDTAAINIQILISGQMEDDFVVDQYLVGEYNDKKTSLERFGNGITWVQVDRVANTLSGYLINPGMYFGTKVDIKDTPTPIIQSWADLQPPISCDSIDQRDLIKINEIFPWNEKYPPYIELAIHGDISLDLLSISGDRLASGLEFLLNSSGTTLEKNSFLLISSTGLWQDQGVQSVRNRDFSLVSTWSWLLITIGSWQTRRVMDIVFLSGNSTGKSSYFSSTSYQCARILDYLDDFSPGFDQKFLKYFPVSTVVKIESPPIATGSQSETGGCLLTWPVSMFSWDTWVSTDISSIINQYTIRIMNVDYDPPGSDTNNEKITLLATNLSGDQTPLDLSKVFRLKVNGTNKTLPRTLSMNTLTTFAKTFGFPNSTDGWKNVIVQLVYDDYVFDTYTYNPNKKEEEEVETGDFESTGVFLDLSWLQFTITYVLPNPKGSDKAEELWLKIDHRTIERLNDGNMETWEVAKDYRLKTIDSLDLSQGFDLRIGTKKKKISGVVYIGQENILSWSLGLVNKAACVSLLYNEQELSKFCYRTPKEGEKIYSSDSWLEQTLQENLDILNTLSLKRINNQLCIRYKEQSFLCKRIPASKAELKTTQEQKLYKWFASLIKQYIINNRKSLYYDTSLKEYFDLVAKNKKLIAQWVSNVDIYGQSIPVTDVKKQLQIMENTPIVVIAIFEGVKVLTQE